MKRLEAFEALPKSLKVSEFLIHFMSRDSSKGVGNRSSSREKTDKDSIVQLKMLCMSRFNKNVFLIKSNAKLLIQTNHS